jgi:hypothetical protein
MKKIDYPRVDYFERIKSNLREVYSVNATFGEGTEFGISMSKIPRWFEVDAWCYVLKFDNGIYKVGVTRDIRRRMYDYQHYLETLLYNPSGFVLMYLLSGTEDTDIKNLCIRYQIVGEHLRKLDPGLQTILSERAVDINIVPRTLKRAPQSRFV